MADVKASLACGLQMCVRDLWMGDNFSDFTVVVNDTSFKCHRFILAACSGFFNGLFQSNMNESRENKVEVNNISESTFGLVLDSIYTGKILLTNDNIFDVWSAALQLQVGYLSVECENFVSENINEDNCFDIFSYAKQHGYEKAEVTCKNFFVSHFEKLKDTEKLLQLSFDEFYSVVDDDSLSTTAEDFVLETILEWVEYNTAVKNNVSGNNQNNCEIVNRNVVSHQSVDPAITDPTCNATGINYAYRSRQLTQLLSACRLCLVSVTCIEQILKNNQLLDGCKDAQSMIIDALMCHMHIERRQIYWPKAATYRLSGNMKHVMVFAGLKNVQIYDLNNGCISDFTEESSNVLNLTVLDNVLLILEKEDDDTLKLSRYHKDGTWGFITNIKSKLYDDPVLLLHGRYVYFLCRTESPDENFNLKRCECSITGYNGKTWSSCCVINDHPDRILGVKKYILIFISKPNTATSTVNCYNTDTGEINTTTIDGTARDMMSFCHQDDIYLLQRGGCLRKIVISDSARVVFERVVNLWDFDCDLSGCVVYHNQLYVFCQDDSRFKTDQHLSSLPGIVSNIKIAGIQSASRLYPMVIPVSSG